MASRDLNSVISPAHMISPKPITSNTTVVGAIFSTAFFQSADFIMYTGVNQVDGFYQMKLIHGDDPALSDGVDVELEFLIGELPGTSFPDFVGRVGYVGHKKFIRADIVSSAVTSGTECAGVLLIFNHPNHAPTQSF